MGKQQQYVLEIPAAVGERITRRARRGKRKPSEVAVEALPRYFALAHFHEETPTVAELRAIRRSEAAIKRGDDITRDELRRPKQSAKKSRI
jgi:hypothetical protein